MTVSELADHGSEREISLIDVRSAEAAAFGMIPGAVNIPLGELSERLDELCRTALIVPYCIRGEISVNAVTLLREAGFEAENLDGGYMAFLRERIEADDAGQKRRDIEHSLQKRFKKRLWCNFTKALKVYDLIQPGDKVAVCISGGKDSMLMAMLFKELLRHSEFPFEVEYLVMDPGYSADNRAVIEANLSLLGIEARIFESDIFESVYNVDKYPCYLCARMRRGYLYKYAQSLGCNKIALGHHYDDVIETILMGMLYGAQIQTMMPKLKSTNFPGMELIRPMYFIREDDIKLWRDANGLGFIQCACRFTDTCTTCDDEGRTKSKRQEIKRLIAEMKKTNPLVESRIFASMENVCLDTVIEYKKDGVRHNFLEEY